MAEYPPGAAEARKRQKQVYSINALCRIREHNLQFFASLLLREIHALHGLLQP